LTDALSDLSDARQLRASVKQWHGPPLTNDASPSMTGEKGADDYIVPIRLGDDRRAVQAASALQEAGFDVRAIRPPTVPEGAACLRISIHADHEPDALRGLAKALTRVLSY
jgi:8-amino-7-oxononanoate synthase